VARLLLLFDSQQQQWAEDRSCWRVVRKAGSRLILPLLSVSMVSVAVVVVARARARAVVGLVVMEAAGLGGLSKVATVAEVSRDLVQILILLLLLLLFVAVRKQKPALSAGNFSPLSS